MSPAQARRWGERPSVATAVDSVTLAGVWYRGRNDPSPIISG
jgi:hypothetical protein